MIRPLTLRQAGGSTSAVLPKDMVDRLHLGPGDQMFAVETERGILLTPYDPKFSKVMNAYRHVARKYRNALNELAK